MTIQLSISARVVSLSLITVSLWAAPNFSGNWKMDAAKSDWGMLPPPAVFERRVGHADPDLVVATRQGGEKGTSVNESKFRTDGSESTVLLSGREAKVKAWWEGSILVVETKRTIGQNETTLVERWQLSLDGKTIRIEGKLILPAGDFPLKVVLEKQ